MKRIYIELKLRIRYIVRGIQTRKELHIGDVVGYKGVRYFINNANKTDTNGVRIYDLVEDVPFDENGERSSIQLKEHQIYKVKCWSNFKRGIMSVYDFNMQCWHKINLKKY